MKAVLRPQSRIALTRWLAGRRISSQAAEVQYRQPQKLPNEVPSWSSPKDSVPQHSFGTEYSQAWSLFEACIENGNFERAESVLYGLIGLAPDNNDVTLAVNNYLMQLVEQNQGNPKVAQNWLRGIFYNAPRFKPNGVTEALMLKNAYLSEDPAFWRTYLADFKADLGSVLNHIEVLGVRTLRDILQNGGIDRSKIRLNARTATLVNSEPEPATNNVPPKSQVDEPIRKPGYETLAPTQSQGLRSIRHVLTGLQLDHDKLSSLPQVLDKSIEKNDFDFFEMSKRLNPEDEEQFYETLEEINKKRQYLIETRGVEAARMKWKAMFERLVELDRSKDSKVNLGGLEMLLWEWNQAMLPLVYQELELVKELLPYKKASDVPSELRTKTPGFTDRFEYGPYLLMAQAENLPAMTMMELLRLNNAKQNEGMKAIRAVLSVGRNVEMDCRIRRFKKREQKAVKGASGQMRQKTLEQFKRQIRKLDMDSSVSSWPTTVQAKVGSLLISLLLKVAKVTVYGKDPVTGQKVVGRAPAFYHTYQYQNGNKFGMVRPHKVVSKYLTGEHTAAVISPQHLPMLAQPRPWTAWDDGGYLFSDSKMIRIRESPEQTAYLAAASKRGQLDTVYEGLNKLGKTPWTINKEMFKVVSKIWNSGHEFIDIPPNVPPQPTSDMLPQEPPRNADPQLRRDYMRTLRSITLDNAAKYSQRCDLNYKLDIARAFLGERFFMPHNLDFRGRAYPLSPHLNHLGNDVSRSLLMFWNGKELGENGLRWLKIHLANLVGNSKISFDDRVGYIEDHMHEVLDSANNPLDGNGWWKTADAPFQALAACIELRDALSLEDPTKFVSHLTVHQDGSCNGLQHYAALGGDFEGAYQVNLSSADKPQDVYTRVLEIVKENVIKDAEEGNEIAERLLPVLSRKVVKQTVMTHVYGVTYIGAREQIANRLKEIEDFPQASLYKASSYAASKVLGAVRQLFTSAHDIQDWLGENALRVTHSLVVEKEEERQPRKKSRVSKVDRPNFMSSVIWTTPLGLPIVQPYRNEKRKQVSTELQTVYITDPFSAQDVNHRKQRTAFPPNYIHSLDATHMLMSAVACENDGIDFAAVHDSYWTHAADVETMNRNLRDTFVKLHSVDLIGELCDEFRERYGDSLQVLNIPKDSELAKRVTTWRADYSRERFGRVRQLTLNEELEAERERRAALANDATASETSISIASSLSLEELGQLTRIANENKPKAPRGLRSTEHEGSGLDSTQMADSENGDAPSGKRGSSLPILVPLRIPDPPARGRFDVTSVLASDYFFS